ncbi:MAG: tRNA-specific adenosine deaminase [Rickettsiales bacterium]|nr:tRNA-specific adenosine deaminase [Rickettsiales bacterium]
MELAFNQAEDALNHDEVPIGAVMVYKGEVIASASNQVERDGDATSHAELLCIHKACEYFANQGLPSKRIPDCDLYVTLEPCTMCAGAIAHARIKNLYFAAQDSKGGAVTSGVQFFDQDTCHHKINVIHMKSFEERSADLLQSFFKAKRQQKQS